MTQPTYTDYLLGVLRAKLEGTFVANEPPMAEWEWELLHAGSIFDGFGYDNTDNLTVTLFAVLENGTHIRFDGVHIDSWSVDAGMLSFEVNEGDQIHYVPNVVRFYTEA
jgi:hypothetical protein